MSIIGTSADGSPIIADNSALIGEPPGAKQIEVPMIGISADGLPILADRPIYRPIGKFYRRWAKTVGTLDSYDIPYRIIFL